MKTLAILAFYAFSLSACVSTGETYTAKGDMVYEVSCRFRSLDTCLAEAGQTCGTLGYAQVQKDGSPLPAPADVPPPTTWDKVRDTVGYDRKVFVKCGHTYKPED